MTCRLSASYRGLAENWSRVDLTRKNPLHPLHVICIQLNRVAGRDCACRCARGIKRRSDRRCQAGEGPDAEVLEQIESGCDRLRRGFCGVDYRAPRRHGPLIASSYYKLTQGSRCPPYGYLPDRAGPTKSPKLTPGTCNLVRHSGVVTRGL